MTGEVKKEEISKKFIVASYYFRLSVYSFSHGCPPERNSFYGFGTPFRQGLFLLSLFFLISRNSNLVCCAP